MAVMGKWRSWACIPYNIVCSVVRLALFTLALQYGSHI
jgi:hypothetical protein